MWQMSANVEATDEDLPQKTEEAFEASKDFFCITLIHAFRSLLFLLETVFLGESFDNPGYLQ